MRPSDGPGIAWGMRGMWGQGCGKRRVRDMRVRAEDRVSERKQASGQAGKRASGQAGKGPRPCEFVRRSLRSTLTNETSTPPTRCMVATLIRSRSTRRSRRARCQSHQSVVVISGRPRRDSWRRRSASRDETSSEAEMLTTPGRLINAGAVRAAMRRAARQRCRSHHA